jgi:MFS family permease
MFTVIAMPVVAVVYLKASAGQVSLLSAAAAVPPLLFGLPAGVFADRVARPRRTLIALDTASALLIGVVAVGLAAHAATLIWLVLLSFAGGCAGIVIEVVYFVHLRQITSDGGIGAARARLQIGQFAAALLGRLAAGPVIVAVGPGAAMGVDAVSYVLSALALLSMSPVVPVAREPVAGIVSTLRGAVSGLKAYTGDRYLRVLMLFVVAPGVGSAGAVALTGPFLLRTVHVPPGAYGLAFALSSLLGLAGSAVARRLASRGRDDRLLAPLMAVAGLSCALLLPLTAGPLPLALAVAALGLGMPTFFSAISNVSLSTVITRAIPEATLGRALATLQILGAGAQLLGSLGAGALAGLISVRSSIWALDGGAAALALLLLPVAIRAASGPAEPASQRPAEPAQLGPD